MSRLRAVPPPAPAELLETDPAPPPVIRAPRRGPRRLRSALTSLVLCLNLALAGLAVAMLSPQLLGSARAVNIGVARGGIVSEVGSFTKINTVTTQDIPISINLVGAATGSWAVIFWTAGSDQAAGVWDPHIITAFGFAANGGGAISQYSVTASSRDANAGGDSGRSIWTAAIALDWVGASVDTAEFTSFPTTTSMRISWTANTGNHPSRVINYMLISRLTGAKALSWTPAGTGDRSVTGAGFSPDLVLHASALLNAMNTTSTGANLGFGAMNASGEQFALAFSSSDAASPSNTSRWQRTDSCYATVDANETAYQRATFVAMEPDGFRVNFATATGNQQIVSLCLDGVRSKIGSFTKSVAAAPVTQDVATGLSFLPRAGMFANVGNSAAVAPAAHAVWSLGATDGINERSVGLADQDALATTSADSIRIDDKAILTNGIATTQALADVALGATTTATWTTNDGSNREIVYLLIG